METSKEPFTPIRIVRFFKNYFEPDTEGLPKIKDIFAVNLPNQFVILSIAGPPSSGKSFFMNLLLQYLRRGGSGDWLNDFTNKREPLRGFVTRDTLTNNAEFEYEGVYMWPELLTVQSSIEAESQVNHKVPVILLDSVLRITGNLAEKSKTFDLLKCMMSTKVIINSVGIFEVKDFLPLLEATTQLRVDDEIIDKDISILVRDSQVGPCGASKAITRIQEIIKKGGGSSYLQNSVESRAMQNVREACFLKKPDSCPICNADGYLHELDQGFMRSVKSFISSVLDSDSLIEGAVTIDDFQNYLQEFCNLANQPFFFNQEVNTESNFNLEDSSVHAATVFAPEKNIVVNNTILKYPEETNLVGEKDNSKHTTQQSLQNQSESGHVTLTIDQVDSLNEIHNYTSRADWIVNHEYGKYMNTEPEMRSQALTKTKITEDECLLEESEQNKSSLEIVCSSERSLKLLVETSSQYHAPEVVSTDSATTPSADMDNIPSSNMDNIVLAKTGDGPIPTDLTSETENYKEAPYTPQSQYDNCDSMQEDEAMNLLPPLPDSPEPMDIDEGDNSNLQENVDKLLAQYISEMTCITAGLNIFKTSSKQIIADKMQTHPCLQQIEDAVNQMENSACIHSEVLNSIESINSEIMSKVDHAIDRYQTSLGLFLKKLRDTIHYQMPIIVQERNDFQDSFSKLYNQILQEYTLSIQEIPHDELKRLLKEDSSEVLNCIKCIGEGLNSYKTRMVKQMEMHKIFSKDSLEALHQETYSKTTGSRLKSRKVEPLFETLFDHGIDCMHKIFTQVNSENISKEKKVIGDIAENEVRVKESYNNIMKELLSTRLWNSSQLEKIHEEIVEEICQAFNVAIAVNTKSIVHTNDYTKSIKANLENIYQVYQLQNQRNAEILQSSINQAIRDNKRIYNCKMEEFIKKDPQGHIHTAEMETTHQRLLEEACRNLSFEIEKLGFLRDDKLNVETLKNKIMDDWGNFKEENERKLQQIEDREREMQKNIKAQEAACKQKDLEEKRKNNLLKLKKDGPISVSSSKTFDQQPVQECELSHKLMKTFTPGIKQKNILNPLAMEFGLHYIRVGWINPESKRFEILNNKWGEEDTPSVVGISKNDEILFGREATTRPFHEMKDKFSMSKLLLDNNDPSTTFGYNIRGKADARKELLMGHMLLRVKEDVENQLQGTWKTIVITVPLWYTSVHRQATKDAAIIAGFKDIYLVNETSAAAMAYIDYTAKSDGSEMIMVGVYNESYYDTAVYSVVGKQIEMLTSGGNYHSPYIQGNKSGGFVKWARSKVKSGCKAAKQWLSGTHDKTDMEKCIKAVVGESRECIRTSVLVNTNPTRYSPYSKEIGPLFNLQFKSNAPAVKTLGNPQSIVQGAVEIARILRETDHQAGSEQKTQLLMNIIQDRLTYGVDVIYDQGSDNTQFFEHKSKLINTKGGSLNQEVTLKKQVYGKQNEIHLQEGFLYIGPLVYCAPSSGIDEVRLKGTFKYDGTLEVKMLNGANKEQIDFDLESFNLTSEQVQSLAEHMEQFQSDFKEKQLLEETKLKLKELIKGMKQNLDSVTGLKHKLATKSIEDAAAMVDHHTSSIPMLESKIEHLDTLRDKYSL